MHHRHYQYRVLLDKGGQLQTSYHRLFCPFETSTKTSPAFQYATRSINYEHKALRACTANNDVWLVGQVRHTSGSSRSASGTLRTLAQESTIVPLHPRYQYITPPTNAAILDSSFFCRTRQPDFLFPTCLCTNASAKTYVLAACSDNQWNANGITVPDAPIEGRMHVTYSVYKLCNTMISPGSERCSTASYSVRRSLRDEHFSPYSQQQNVVESTSCVTGGRWSQMASEPVGLACDTKAHQYTRCYIHYSPSPVVSWKQ